MKYVYLFLCCCTIFLWSCSEPDNAAEPEEPTEKPEDKDPDKEGEENNGFVDDTDFGTNSFGKTTTTPVSEKQFDAQKFFFAMKSFNNKKKYEQLVSGGKVETVSRITITIKDPSKLKNVSKVSYFLSDENGVQRICNYKLESRIGGLIEIKNLVFGEGDDDSYLGVKSTASGSGSVFQGFRAIFHRKQLESITFLVTLGGGKPTPTLKRGEFTVAYSSK